MCLEPLLQGSSCMQSKFPQALQSWLAGQQSSVLLSVAACSFPTIARSYVFTLHLSWRQDHSFPHSSASSPVVRKVCCYPNAWGWLPEPRRGPVPGLHSCGGKSLEL